MLYGVIYALFVLLIVLGIIIFIVKVLDVYKPKHFNYHIKQFGVGTLNNDDTESLVSLWEQIQETSMNEKADARILEGLILAFKDILKKNKKEKTIKAIERIARAVITIEI